MNCDRCQREFNEGEEVEVTYPAAVIAGKVQQTEEESVHHIDGCDFEEG